MPTPLPKCVIVTGRPGAGKTTLAKKLGQCLWMPVISRDELKEGYVNTFGVKHDQLPVATNGQVNDIFFDVVGRLLANSVSVIAEAAFQHALWEPRLAALRELGRISIVTCILDADAAADRHLQRGLKDLNREYYHGDKRVSLYRSGGALSPPAPYIPPAFDLPTIEVSTMDGYVPELDIVKRFVEASHA